MHKILIVDDNLTTVRELTTPLERAGFSVISATDGAEAVKIAQSEQPDLVVLDIFLPVLNGFEVLEQIKKRKIETRVIMFSGERKDLETAVRCIRDGACDFLEKPVLPRQLVEKIRKYILVENTINLRVSDPSPIVNDLVEGARALEKKLKAAEKREEKLLASAGSSKRIHPVIEAMLKLIYVAIVVGGVAALAQYQLVSSAYGAVAAFLLLTLFLLIPIDRIRSITAGGAHIKTKIDLK